MATYVADPVPRLSKRQLEWELTGLEPTPEEEWHRLQEFLGLGQADIRAMLETVEPLFRRGHELVVGNYDYLLSNHETAAILGWKQGADPEHLAERRQFLTVWLARTLGMDFSNDFAHYLFRAGQMHAGHGTRQIHVPEVYVTGAISLVNATFARFLSEEMPAEKIVPMALAGWNKVLSMHLHMMLMGYRSARALDCGDFTVDVSVLNRLRPVIGRRKVTMRLPLGARMDTALRKFLNYFPQAREHVFDTVWVGDTRLDDAGTPWMTVEKVYAIKVNPAWRVMLNGRDIRYIGGPEAVVSPGDGISIVPPGR